MPFNEYVNFIIVSHDRIVSSRHGLIKVTQSHRYIKNSSFDQTRPYTHARCTLWPTACRNCAKVRCPASYSWHSICIRRWYARTALDCFFGDKVTTAWRATRDAASALSACKASIKRHTLGRLIVADVVGQVVVPPLRMIVRPGTRVVNNTF